MLYPVNPTYRSSLTVLALAFLPYTAIAQTSPGPFHPPPMPTLPPMPFPPMTGRSGFPMTGAHPMRPRVILTVTGEAHRALANTVENATLTIEVRAADPAAAMRQLDTKSHGLGSYLESQSPLHLRNAQISLHPERVQGPLGSPPSITGYVARQEVQVTVQASAMAGLIAGAFQHGVTGLSGVFARPRQAEIIAARQELLRQAVQAAIGDARVMAEAAGLRYGGVLSMTAQPSFPPTILPMAAMNLRANPDLRRRSRPRSWYAGGGARSD